ncbi:MAG: four helix bundle protein [Candidatus Curtissbacteria bacterium]|nr:four helix bundle protein [Candidatus Curtissbacteria bacterium]
MIRDVTDLEVYQQSLDLMDKLYGFLKRIPISEYDSVKQCKRCSKSIPANIAEGFAKKSSGAEFKRFLKIALGSSDETITHLRTISIALPHLKVSAYELANEYKTLSKRINKLHQIWQSG